MADPPDKQDDPTDELKQGLTHLWRAARVMATSVKKEVERTDFGKELSGAGKELVRAASNVAERIAGEVSTLATNARTPPPAGATPPPPKPPADEEDEFDGVKPTRIAVEPDKK